MPVDITDVSSNNLHLSNQNDVVYSSEGLTPFYNFDGTNYLYYSAATAEFNITGDEAYIDSNGLTLMCWARVTAFASNPTLIAKEGASINQYGLFVSTTSNPTFRVSTNGTTVTSIVVTSASVSDFSDWNFYCGRWTAGGDVEMYVNDTLYSAGVTVNAPLYTGAAVFSLGSRNGGNLLTGDLSMCGIYASSLSDDQILTIYDMTAPLFKPSI